MASSNSVRHAAFTLFLIEWAATGQQLDLSRWILRLRSCYKSMIIK
jgi:hypothetical protein